MKKKYIQPNSKCIDLGLEDMIAQSPAGIGKGEGSGSHEADSNVRGFFEEESDDLW